MKTDRLEAIRWEMKRRIVNREEANRMLIRDLAGSPCLDMVLQSNQAAVAVLTDAVNELELLLLEELEHS